MGEHIGAFLDWAFLAAIKLLLWLPRVLLELIRGYLGPHAQLGLAIGAGLGFSVIGMGLLVYSTVPSCTPYLGVLLLIYLALGLLVRQMVKGYGLLE